MPDEEIEPRLSALERRGERSDSRLDRHDRQLADLHRLASGTDRDVSAIMGKLDAHERSIQALHLDMRDLERKVDEGFTEMRGGFEEMRSGFAITAAGLTVLAERLDRLDPAS